MRPEIAENRKCERGFEEERWGGLREHEVPALHLSLGGGVGLQLCQELSAGIAAPAAHGVELRRTKMQL